MTSSGREPEAGVGDVLPDRSIHGDEGATELDRSRRAVGSVEQGAKDSGMDLGVEEATRRPSAVVT